MLIIPVSNIKQATTFNIKIARSFQITPIAIQPAQPIKERHISANGNLPVDLSVIAIEPYVYEAVATAVQASVRAVNEADFSYRSRPY